MIFITGASAGIGEACARKFAARGQDLLLSARRLERVEKLARELAARHGVEVHARKLDVSDAGAVEALARADSGLLARVRVLVNNAGLARGLGTIQEGDPRDWDEMIDTNIKGLLYVTHAVLPHFRRAGAGHVVNLGSAAGYWPYAKGNVYSATKFAVRALTESMRLDLLGAGIRVTEIAPGMVETEFSEVRLGGDKERAKAVYAGMTPLTADDVAEAVVWSVERPPHMNVQSMVLYPTDQASTSAVHRRGSPA
jgi:3-hydroxy acid dehydrogenase / malonic semialdehyde reductase